ncbi:hypothetical protein [Aquimonas voraii]|uniref:hypothetical protein n=1 Tax=Aquimonas voraii TaxID=265719 RepID=UPI00115FFB18|nr:hypothetical protein [Aquimonas voraii]
MNPPSEPHRFEGVPVLQALSDLVDFVRRDFVRCDRRLDPLAVKAMACHVFGMQRQGPRVRADPRVDRALRVCGVARPGVLAGLADPARTDRIDFDRTVTAQQVIVGVHRAGLEAAIPKSAGAALAIVDAADAATPPRNLMALTQPIAAGVSSRYTRSVINK